MFPTEFLLDLISTVWSEPSGQIFLLSVAYYLFSAFTVSGYMAYFAGGFGNIGFGDYTLLDFLFFLPTLAVTGLTIIADNILRVLAYILFFVITPNFVGLLIAFWIFNQTDWLGDLSPLLISLLFYISLVSWFIGVTLLLSDSTKRWISFLTQLLSILLFSITSVVLVSRGLKPLAPNIDPTIISVIAFIGNLFFLFTSIGGLLLILLLIGTTIARQAVKEKYLSKIIRVQLAKPVQGLERWRVEAPNTGENNWFSLLKPSQPDQSNHRYEPKGDVLLVATLKRVTAFYVHDAEETNGKNGNLILVSNADIQSLELKSAKKVDSNHSKSH